MPAPLITAALVVAAGYALARAGRQKEPSVRALKADLRRLSGGGEPTVQRLVRFEMRKSPRISEVEAYKRAIARLERDRR